MGLGAALKSVLTRFNFQMDGGKLVAINAAASKTDARFAKAAGSAALLQQRLGSLFKKAALLGGALLGGLGIKSVTTDVAAAALEIDRMSDALGVSTDFFQELQFALDTQTTGGQKAAQVIADVSERLFDAAGGSKALRDDFALLGLTQAKMKQAAKEGPEAQFNLLADAMERAGPGAERTFVAMSGLSDTGKDLIPLLKQGSKGFRKIAADAHRYGVVLDKDAIKQGKILAERMIIMRARIRGARNAIAMRLMPAVNDMVAGFSAWIASTENQTKLLIGLATAAGIAAIAIASMLAPRILAAVKVFGGQLSKILKLLRGINIQMALASIKILAVVAAAAFLGLVVDDLIGFVRGDKSVTEQLFGRSQVIIDGLLSIRDTFMDMLDALGESFGKLWGSIVDLAGAFGIELTTFKALLIGIGKIILGFVVVAIIAVGNAFTAVLWVIGKIIELINFLVRVLVDSLLAVVNEMKEAWEDLGDAVVGVVTRIEDAAFTTAVRIAAFFRRAAKLAGETWDSFYNWWADKAQRVANFATRGKNWLLGRDTGVASGLPSLPGAAGAGGPKGGPNGTKPGATVTQTTTVGEIIVHAAPGQDEKKVGEAVKTELQNFVNTAFKDMVPDL